MPRQSEPTPDVIRARARFSEALRARLVELGVREGQEKWLHEKLGVRWQTAQAWLAAESFPLGHNLSRLAEALSMDARALVGPMLDDVEPRYPSWAAFLATPEGASITEDERWPLRLFAWPKPPSVSDYRALLTVIRNNAT
jgi:hypothetical protein